MSRGDLVAMRPDLPDIVDAVLWPVGGVLVHDAIVAPRNRADRGRHPTGPAPARAAVVTGLVVVLTVTGWAVSAGLVALGTVIGVAPLRRRRQRRPEGDG